MREGAAMGRRHQICRVLCGRDVDGSHVVQIALADVVLEGFCIAWLDHRRPLSLNTKVTVDRSAGKRTLLVRWTA